MPEEVKKKKSHLKRGEGEKSRSKKMSMSGTAATKSTENKNVNCNGRNDDLFETTSSSKSNLSTVSSQIDKNSKISQAPSKMECGNSDDVGIMTAQNSFPRVNIALTKPGTTMLTSTVSSKSSVNYMPNSPTLSNTSESRIGVNQVPISGFSKVNFSTSASVASSPKAQSTISADVEIGGSSNPTFAAVPSISPLTKVISPSDAEAMLSLSNKPDNSIKTEPKSPAIPFTAPPSKAIPFQALSPKAAAFMKAPPTKATLGKAPPSKAPLGKAPLGKAPPSKAPPSKAAPPKAPAINPLRKGHKRLFWNGMSDAKIAGSLFEGFEDLVSSSNSAYINLSDEALYQKFFVSDAAKAKVASLSNGEQSGAKATPKKVEEAKIKLFDEKLAQKLSIALFKLRGATIEDLCTCLQKLDASIIPPESFECLNLVVSDNNVFSVIREYIENDGDPNLLRDLEKRLIPLSFIRRPASRLQFIIDSLEFPSLSKDLCESLISVMSACEEIRRCETICEFLLYCLVWGNLVNHGPSNLVTKGFSVMSVNRFMEYKSPKDKDLNGFLVVVVNMIAQFPNLQYRNATDELTNFNNVTKLNASTITDLITRCKAPLLNLDNEIEKFSELYDDSIDVMLKLKDEWESGIALLQKIIDATVDVLKNTYTYFGSLDLTLSDPLSKFEEFFQCFNYIIKEVEQVFLKVKQSPQKYEQYLAQGLSFSSSILASSIQKKADEEAAKKALVEKAEAKKNEVSKVNVVAKKESMQTDSTSEHDNVMSSMRLTQCTAGTATHSFFRNNLESRQKTELTEKANINVAVSSLFDSVNPKSEMYLQTIRSFKIDETQNSAPLNEGNKNGTQSKSKVKNKTGGTPIGSPQQARSAGRWNMFKF